MPKIGSGHIQRPENEQDRKDARASISMAHMKAKSKALEKGREITPHRATDKEVEGLPKCKVCGKRATRMDFHMQEHK